VTSTFHFISFLLFASRKHTGDNNHHSYRSSPNGMPEHPDVYFSVLVELFNFYFKM
jgi:hypothetical protein